MTQRSTRTCRGSSPRRIPSTRTPRRSHPSLTTTIRSTSATAGTRRQPLRGVIDYANAVVYPFGYGLSRYNNVTVEPTPEALANSNYTELDFQDGQVSADFLDVLGAIDFGMTFKE